MAEPNNYTAEQAEDVNRVNGCTNLYAMLGVTKKCTNKELKDAFDSLSLKFDPERNRAPGANDAFRAIRRAYSILCNPQSRLKYNLQNPSRQNRPHYGNNGASGSSSTNDSGANSQQSNYNLRQRHNRNKEETTDTTKENYTREQAELVNKVLGHTNLYDILGVTENCTENQLKTAYKKLSLIVHPDKNSAPKASEAFKAINGANLVLSDPEKRRSYDSKILSARRQAASDWPPPTPEYWRPEAPPQQASFHFFPRRNQYGKSQAKHGDDSLSMWFVMKLLAGILLFSALIRVLPETLDSIKGQLRRSFPLSKEDLHSKADHTPYKIYRTKSFNKTRRTALLNAPYFVEKDFMRRYGSLKSGIEKEVESTYHTVEIPKLRAECSKDQKTKTDMLSEAERNNNRRAYHEVASMELKSCILLHSLRLG